MKHIATIFTTMLLPLTLSACVGWGMDKVKQGQTESEVIAELGAPTHEYRDGDQHLLEYMRGRMAQATHIARIGSDGKLISYEQVLTLQKFAQVQVGVSNEDNILHLLGAPNEVDHYPRTNLLAWSYAFKESGEWNSLMTIYFNEAGVVQKMENGPDPLFDGERLGHHRH